MQSDETFIEKRFELINELTSQVTFVTVKVPYLTSTREINISRAINDIHNQGINGLNLNNSLLFYLDINKRLYVHIGTFPFAKHFEFLLKFELFLETTIKLRYRKLSEPSSPKEKKTVAQDKRSRKEKTIQQVQDIVAKWRELFEKTDEYGKKVHTLEQAAKKLGMQKKTLDDYYYKIKSAQAYGFDFEKLKHEKIGVLRQFVKDCKKKKMAKTYVQPLPFPKPYGQGIGGQLGNGTMYGINGMSATMSASFAGSTYPNQYHNYQYQKPPEDDISKYLVQDNEDFSSPSDSQDSN